MLKTIRLNNEDKLVAIAQYLMGFAEREKATELFTKEFENYVIKWQSNNNLTADGIIGKNTWTKVADFLPTCSTTKNKKSAYVCGLQLLLGGINADGIYGMKTKKAVAAYQSANGLSADGICGKRTWGLLIIGTAASPSGDPIGKKVLNNCVKYLQWDSKWKKVVYTSCGNKNQTIGNSGCGPTSMAMIVATFIDPKVTPVQMCELAVKNGYRTKNSGTSWGFYPFIFKHYDGFEKYISTSSINVLIAALAEGALAVCSMNSNDNNFWTKGGHFIVARGFDDQYIYANDPNKSETPRRQAISKFQKCMKQAFIYWPKKKLTKHDDDEKIICEPIDPPVPEVEMDLEQDKHIVDISKWQGTINFEALKEDVSLVIARASCGSDKDSKIASYTLSMDRLGIPYGVYCYSYARDAAKATDEVEKLLEYTKTCHPLFYVMDAEEACITNDTIRVFAQELKKRTTKPIGCYVANHKYAAYKYDSVRDLFDFTWIPHYGKNTGTLEGATKPKYKCDLWQYTSKGKVNGIRGDADLNIITGEGHDLAWFLGKGE